MKICLTGSHRYPARAFRVCGGGRAGARVADHLARGLVELGHEVFYYLREGAAEALPEGVTLASAPRLDADVLHVQHVYLSVPSDPRWPPSVRTCHGDNALRRGVAIDDPIFVSRTHAASHGSTRFVRNGIDPAEAVFSAAKDAYFLFACNLKIAFEKGLAIALEACRRFGARLLVAGSTTDARMEAEVALRCRQYGAEMIGDVRGARKAELFAGARALLFPTQLNESFGLVIAEALMSGTPVIASDRGACPELVTPDAGFVCATIEDYVEAMERCRTISSHACREKAMREFHYRRMAADYVREYEREMAQGSAFAERFTAPTEYSCRTNG